MVGGWVSTLATKLLSSHELITVHLAKAWVIKIQIQIDPSFSPTRKGYVRLGEKAYWQLMVLVSSELHFLKSTEGLSLRREMMRVTQAKIRLMNQYACNPG